MQQFKLFRHKDFAQGRNASYISFWPVEAGDSWAALFNELRRLGYVEGT